MVSLSVKHSELCRLQIPEFALFGNSPVTVSSVYLENLEFATAITQNILDLESQPWKPKLFRMRFSVG